MASPALYKQSYLTYFTFLYYLLLLFIMDSACYFQIPMGVNEESVGTLDALTVTP